MIVTTGNNAATNESRNLHRKNDRVSPHPSSTALLLLLLFIRVTQHISASEDDKALKTSSVPLARFPNTWDASPSAQWFRAQYPGGNFPAYPGEETTIVGGDPMAEYPVQQYGAPSGGTLQPYGPSTYYY